MQKKLPDVSARAHAHKGASFVEIYQNCIVYNDGEFFSNFTEIRRRGEPTDRREHGKPERSLKLRTTSCGLRR